MLLATGGTWGLQAPVILYAIGVVALSASLGHYRPRLSFRALDDLPTWGLTLAAPLLVFAPWAFQEGIARPVAWSIGGIWIAVCVVRAVAFAIIRSLRRRGFLLEDVILIGAGRLGRELSTVLADRREYGLVPVGVVDSLGVTLDDAAPVPVLGDLNDLAGILERYKVRRVIVAFGPLPEASLVGVMRTTLLARVDVHVIPRFFDLAAQPHDRHVDDVWGIPLYRVRRAALHSGVWRWKRCLDVLLSSLALLVAAIPMAVCAIAMRISDPDGPVFFRQQRIGQHGRPFELLKLRTLPVSHDGVSTWNAERAAMGITPVGRWLRRSSLDELPQLWNVLRGDMSLIGPRPERPNFVERFRVDVPGYGDRHRLPVGLTGWAQVNGLRGDTSISERARFDNHYIEHWSLWFDVKILLLTVVAVLNDFLRTRR